MKHDPSRPAAPSTRKSSAIARVPDVTGAPDDRCPRPSRGGDAERSQTDLQSLNEELTTANTRLENARLYAEAIVDTVREPLVVLDSDLRVVSANRAFYTTFMVSQKETAGRSLYELGGGEWNIPQLRILLGEVLPQHHVMNDFRIEHDFGTTIGPRSMLLNARALLHGNDRPELILLAIEDVTVRERLQEALLESELRKSRIEQVRQRQAELAHALRISTIGELASGLAHELGQPLTAIANGVEACAGYVRSGRDDPARFLTMLAEASREAVRAAGIVKHLRRFIEKGSPELEPADLSDIAHDVPHLLRHEIEQERITLRLDLAKRPLPVLADRIQIEQIVVNLIQNAIEGIRDAPAGGVREIHLRVWSFKGKAQVNVRDTGAGIPADVAERVFDPFFTTKKKGLGMGLAISRSIIEAHRGAIWMETPADGQCGTALCFSLPLKRSPARKTRST